jgi:hypothetical protein
VKFGWAGPAVAAAWQWLQGSSDRLCCPLLALATVPVRFIYDVY